MSNPTIINGGLAKGFMWGGVIGSLAGIGVAVGLIALTGGFAAVPAAFGALAGTTGAALSTGAGASIIAGAVVGSFVNIKMMVDGCLKRRDEMRDDYSIAEKWQARQTANISSPTHSQERSTGYQFDNTEMVAQRGDWKWQDDVRQGVNHEAMQGR